MASRNKILPYLYNIIVKLLNVPYYNMNLGCLDVVNCKVKNLQKINSIEIFYYIDMSNRFVIEYSFHCNDFELWKKILCIHKKCADSLLYVGDVIVDETSLKNDSIYYDFALKSKNPNLYKNINLLFYIEEGLDEECLIKKIIKKNSWEN